MHELFQPITVGICCLRAIQYTANTDCDWLKQLKTFQSCFSVSFLVNKTVSFLFYSQCRMHMLLILQFTNYQLCYKHRTVGCFMAKNQLLLSNIQDRKIILLDSVQRRHDNLDQAAISQRWDVHITPPGAKHCRQQSNSTTTYILQTSVICDNQIPQNLSVL